MMYTYEELLTIACEVISYVDGDMKKAQSCRYGNSNPTTRELLALLRSHNELNRRSNGALLAQISQCVTGSYVTESCKWNERKNSKIYAEMYKELC